MSEDNSLDKMLEELRRQFAFEADGYVDRLNELAAQFSKEARASVAEILALCHNIKGSAQAVGYPSMAAAMHGVEDALSSFARRDISATEVSLLDPRLQEVIDATNASLKQLSETLEDQQALGEEILKQASRLSAPAEPASPQVTTSAGWGVFEDKPSWGIFEDAPSDQAPARATTMPSASPSSGWGIFEDHPAAPEPTVEPVVSKPAEALPGLDEPNEPATASAPESSKFLLVEQRGQLFAIDLIHVREIVSHQCLNSLPDPTAGILGMIVVRDRALPVLDLGGLFPGEDAAGVNDCVCSVICETKGQGFAFNVENPRQVVELASHSFECLDEKFGDPEGSKVVTHVTSYEGRSVFVIDLQSIAA